MKRICQKLQSRRGASLSFALLLFLVCAVVGSVVLAAGTAAAGRASRMAQRDQRYYSVTSAAVLMREMLDGKIITVVEKTTGVSSDTPFVSRTITVEGVEEPAEAAAGKSLLTDAANRLTQDAPDGQSDFGMPLMFSRDLTLKANTGQDEVETLNVKIRESLDTDGTMILEITGTGTEGGDGPAFGSDGGAYTLQLTFTADIRETTDSQMVTDTLTKTTKITWALSGIRTLTGEVTP